jgi:hypothetical protein
MVFIDDPYTLEQLLSPRITVSIVRPLVDRLYDPDNISIGKPFSFDLKEVSMK